MNFFVLFIAFLFVASTFCYDEPDLYKIREWKKLDFKFPNAAIRADALKTKKWVPENAFPIDVDIHYQGRKKIKEKSLI